MHISKVQTNFVQQNKLKKSRPVTNSQVVNPDVNFSDKVKSKYYIDINFKGVYDSDDYEETEQERIEREREREQAETERMRTSLLEAIDIAYGDNPVQYESMRPLINAIQGQRTNSSVSSGISDRSYNNAPVRTETLRENRVMSNADRQALLDRIHRLDYYNRYGGYNGIAVELRRQLDQMNTVNTVSETVERLKSQGRTVVEALSNNYLVKLKDEEILPDMKINGFDYYITLGGLLYVDSKRCPEYQMFDDNDVSEDYYDPMFDERPNYIWVNGIGRVNMDREPKHCKAIRSEQAQCRLSDENYYFKVLAACRKENYNLIKDINGIYYAPVTVDKLPYELQNQDIYLNIWDGSWHAANSSVFGGPGVSQIDSNIQNPGYINLSSDVSNAPGGISGTGIAANVVEESNKPLVAPPPFKTERIELELTSTDSKIKEAAIKDIIDYINSDSFDKDFKDKRGRNIVHLAMLSRDERIKTIISRAIDKGIDINSQNAFGQTPLMLAIKNLITVKNEDEKSVDMSIISFILNNNNSDINIQDNNKQTAFHLACISKVPALLTLILSKNPNVLLKDITEKMGADYIKLPGMKAIYRNHVMR